MSTPLMTQIRSYYTYLEEQQEAVDVAVVAGRRVGLRSVRPIRPIDASGLRDLRSRWTVTTAAAAAVLVLVGGVALFLQNGAGNLADLEQRFRATGATVEHVGGFTVMDLLQARSGDWYEINGELVAALRYTNTREFNEDVVSINWEGSPWSLRVGEEVSYLDGRGGSPIVRVGNCVRHWADDGLIVLYDGETLVDLITAEFGEPLKLTRPSECDP